ncbi:MAG TPA: hypothetical protein DEO84_03020, partial [candidate division Zixibacteria bacterium]|nr:hypothetical protein [candidate division Zixibacteria bacterium]
LKDNVKEPSEKIKAAFEVIDKELSAKETWLFDTHYSDIARQLQETMILTAFGEDILYQEVQLSGDSNILEALNILADGNRYAGILTTH